MQTNADANDGPAFPNRVYPQLAPVAASAHRPGNVGAAGESRRGAEGRTVAIIAVRERAAKFGLGWKQ